MFDIVIGQEGCGLFWLYQWWIIIENMVHLALLSFTYKNDYYPYTISLFDGIEASSILSSIHVLIKT